jgi:hypothetical protein
MADFWMGPAATLGEPPQDFFAWVLHQAADPPRSESAGLLRSRRRVTSAKHHARSEAAEKVVPGHQLYILAVVLESEHLGSFPSGDHARGQHGRVDVADD